MSIKKNLAKHRTVKPDVQGSKLDDSSSSEVSPSTSLKNEIAPAKSRFGATGRTASTFYGEDDDPFDDVADSSNSARPMENVALAVNESSFEQTTVAPLVLEEIDPTQSCTQDLNKVLPDSGPNLHEDGSNLQETSRETSVIVDEAPVRGPVQMIDQARDPHAWYLDEGDIPQGSAYSLEQWSAAVRKAGSDNVVYELHNGNGRKLTTMPSTRSHAGEIDDIEGKIFGFSLVTSSDVHSQQAKTDAGSPPVHTTYIHREWQHKECPVTIYMVTRSRNAIAKGSNWVIWRNWPKDGETTEHQRDMANRKTNGYGNQQYVARKPNSGDGAAPHSRFAFKQAQSGSRPRG